MAQAALDIVCNTAHCNANRLIPFLVMHLYAHFETWQFWTQCADQPLGTIISLCVLTSVTRRLCDSFFLAFMILTIAASILETQS